MRKKDPALITVKQLAQYLNVPVSWVYRRKDIPRIKIGKYVRYNLEEVEEYFEESAYQKT